MIPKPRAIHTALINFLLNEWWIGCSLLIEDSHIHTHIHTSFIVTDPMFMHKLSCHACWRQWEYHRKRISAGDSHSPSAQVALGVAPADGQTSEMTPPLSEPVSLLQAIQAGILQLHAVSEQSDFAVPWGPCWKRKSMEESNAVGLLP